MTAAGREVVICSTLRTPVGRYGGTFKSLSATALAATVIKGLIERTGLPPERIDDVILGQCYPSGESPAIGRVAALDAGLPIDVPGIQLDRRCGSGLQAVINATMQVQTGACDVVLAGGAESMSQVEFYSPTVRWGPAGEAIQFHDRLARARVTAGGEFHPVPGGMLETAENLRREYSIPRAEQDLFALGSHQKAVAAQESGRFDDEIIPVEVTDRKGKVITVTRDEHPRADSSMESLGALRPMLGRQDPESTVTAGNASGQNDGASICLVTTREIADELGLQPLVRLASWGVAGVPPRTMGIGPVPAVKKALDRIDL